MASHTRHSCYVIADWQEQQKKGNMGLKHIKNRISKQEPTLVKQHKAVNMVVE